MSRLLGIALACAALHAQTFEAASVKTAIPLGPLGQRSERHGGPGTTDPGLFTCQNCNLHSLVEQAYGIRQEFAFSGPDWLGHYRFDVTAKVPAGATKAEFQAMFQKLLAERFLLAVHREKRTMAVYEMTVGRGGPKFKAAAPDDPAPDAPQQPMKRDTDGFPILPPGYTMAAIPGHARIHLAGKPMADLASMLAGQLQMPVIDATGLTGTYDFLVSWAWDESKGAMAAREEGFSALIEAVESLGLRLDQKKGQQEVLVVDHCEKAPAEN